MYIAAPRRSAASGLTEALRRWWPVLGIVAVTFAIRSISFGNPNLDHDEQLYLVIGDRLLHGHLPYVEHWDRKPIGLFLFYAAIRALGGDGIVQYQAAAAGCVAITASLIWAMARRVTGNSGAIVAAIGYVLMLDPLHGVGGQSPVIYNVLTAIAAWAAFRANDTQDARVTVRLALLAMAMSGIAIQFKYTPVVEGTFFGCYFLWRLHRAGVAGMRLALAAAAMVVVALLPTIAVIGCYWALGHLDALVQANFVSVFQRNPFPTITRVRQYIFVALIGGPALALVPAALSRWWGVRPTVNPADRWLVTGWLVAAAAGFGMLGDFYDFYFITVALPLMIVVSCLVSMTVRGILIAAVLILWPFVLAPPIFGQARESRVAIERLTSTIQPYVRDRCLYVFDGPTILYLTTNACAATRYLYPDHLTNPTESPALGVDAAAEEARLLATRPGAIVTADRAVIPRINPATQALVKAALAQDYVLVARIPTDRTYFVYVLRTLHPGPPLAAAPVNPV